MPVDVAEDSLDLMIELLEAGSPSGSSYPYPHLNRTGRLDRRTFRVITLENPYLRATVVPDLGGRILRLEDKRTGNDVWPFSQTLELSGGGPRGIESPAGLQLITGFRSRLNSLGHVTSSPDFAAEEEEPSGIWWGELCGDGLSLNCRYSIPPDAACLEIEVRAFNRSFEPVPYNGGLSFGLDGGWQRLGSNWLWQGPESELLVEPAETWMSYAEGGSLFRFDRVRYLAPRQLDSWKVRLYPSGIGANLRQANGQIAVGWSREELALQASTPIPGSKVIVLLEDKTTLEMPVDLFPEYVHRVPLDTLTSGIAELVLLSAGREELVRASQLPRATTLSRGRDEAKPESLKPDDPDLQNKTFEVAQRHIAHLLLGYRQLAERNYTMAAQELEQVLLFNAEDHLAWWLKAVVERLAGNDEGERPELLNAHFLAPLEPALRAESYLSSPSQAKEKSAVLNPLEETPEAFIEVACLLVEAGLLEEAAKWIDEALRHTDLPMLRYLLAYAYLKGSRMEVQAGEQIQLAVRQEPEPPFPWRPIEIEALQALQERFPADGSLKRIMRS